MGVKRSLSEANPEQQGNSRKQTRLSFAGTSRSSSSPSNTNDEQPRPAKELAAPKPASIKKSTPDKLYKATLKDVDKTFDALLKGYKANPKPGYGVTSDDFAKAMASFIPTAKALKEDSPTDAFNLLLDLGEHAYGDLGGSIKASGWGDTDEPFKEMDDLLVDLVNELREAENAHAKEATEKHAGKFKIELPYSDLYGEERTLRQALGKKSPNKQQRGQLDRARRADLKKLLDTRRERREATEDWMGNALNDLVETAGRIDQYGIGDHFFRKSIDLLTSIKGVERPCLRPPPRMW
ncbi:hypothetical protein F5Y06DRAFT_182069 [Hypoxylon sp. FL0890]|nr:hypothetical protein F5Y06DRAFT_182069 [Hypoxylon sp. FL0890]